MEWLDRMSNSIKYIEDNITGEIDYEKLASIACCSSYHFQRMFSFITDTPISEYIRRRKFTLAAFDLQNTEERIIDIALKYGYDSADSFTRAFQRMHGVTPSLARDKGVELKAYPKLSFHLTIKGDVEMNYRIEEKGAFKVFGFEKVVDNTNGNNFRIIPKFWEECMNNGAFGKLESITVKNKPSGLGCVNAIMCYEETGKETFPYMIGIVDFDGNTEVPDGLKVIGVKAYTWAVFKTDVHSQAETTQMIQELWKRIYPEWFPSSGYENAGGPEMELYYETPDNKYYSEVWIPVIKK